MPEVTFASLLAELPPEPAKSVMGEIQAWVTASRRKVVVLDDDPTGTQTVHGISVLTEWTVSILQAELETDSPAFYILTNSRSLSLDQAQALNREIGANLKTAAQRTVCDFVIISRSDSTLRGHFPGELDALAEGLETPFDGLILAPYFREGGRYTINDIHYVVDNGKALPAAETEFARDPVFGYRESNLRSWVAEKTEGKIRSEAVVSLSIQDIRDGSALEKLLKLAHGQVCIVNAACDADIEQVTLALLQAEDQGKRFLYRTAASFVRTRAGISHRSLLTSAELDSGSSNGGLIVVGSFVPKTTAQLKALRASQTFVEIELQVEDLLSNTRRPSVLSQAIELANRAIARGQDVLLFTSRALVTGADTQESLKIGSLVSESLVTCVRGLTIRPRYLIAKGGITSSDVATKGLGVRKALVLGQVHPGVPAWKLGAESRYPDLAYVVFPGNVGDERALIDVVTKFTNKEGSTC